MYMNMLTDNWQITACYLKVMLVLLPFHFYTLTITYENTIRKAIPFAVV